MSCEAYGSPHPAPIRWPFTFHPTTLPVVVWEAFEDFLYDSNAMLFLTMAKYLLYFGFSIHFISCLWYLVGRLEGTHGNYVSLDIVTTASLDYSSILRRQ